MKHTPAPWTHTPKSAFVWDASGNHIIADTDTGGSRVPEFQANARLIAAAPELLDALKNAVARMEENKPPKAKRGDLEATFKNATFYRDLEAARAAILKAESE